METVEISKNGEIYEEITCRKLIVNKGGTFNAKTKMLNADTN
jgi:cytoskeletal protein CcmA (bactofilin family)